MGSADNAYGRSVGDGQVERRTDCPGSASGVTVSWTIGGGSTGLRTEGSQLFWTDEAEAQMLTFLLAGLSLERFMRLLANFQVYIPAGRFSISSLASGQWACGRRAPLVPHKWPGKRRRLSVSCQWQHR